MMSLALLIIRLNIILNKLDKSKLLSYINDPSMSNAERDEYQKRLNDLKSQKDDFKKKNNIKGTVIVENEEDEYSDDEDIQDEAKGKISEIYNNTMSDFNKNQKDQQRLQKEKEAAALAKLDIMKAERSKNKIINSAGKGIVTNNLSSKLKSISQNKEYDATKLMKEESKTLENGKKMLEEVKNIENPLDIPIKRRQIFVKGRKIGVVDFQKAAVMCQLRVPNIFLKNNQIIHITDIKSDIEKIPGKAIGNTINEINSKFQSDSSPAVMPVMAKQSSKIFILLIL